MRLLTMHYGPRWRMIRKVLHSMLHVTVAKRYVPYQSLESKQMLQEILDHPEGLMESLQRYSNSLTTQMTFGWRTISNQDPKLTILFESLDRFEHLTQTGIAAVVDFFPILQALPGFLMPLKAFATIKKDCTSDIGSKSKVLSRQEHRNLASRSTLRNCRKKKGLAMSKPLSYLVSTSLSAVAPVGDKKSTA
jgi:hypothetical protein